MRSSAQSQSRFKPRARIERALSAWARSRQGEDNTPLTLRSRRIYILPTRAGVVAAALLFVMFLAGMNYQNSLALLLCFLLSGFALVTMYECHGTLTGLEIDSAQAESAFAGSHGELLLGFHNARATARRSLRLRVSETAPKSFDLPPRHACPVRVRYLAHARGRQRIDRVQLSSNAPLGLFRAWTWLHLPLEAVIYPAPVRLRPLPPPVGLPRRSERERRLAGEEEWAWLRPFRDSDSLRRVAWKAYARGAPLMVAHYDAPAGAQHSLGLQSLRDLPLESALSQLADWVLECERRGESYALELPGQGVGVGHGVAQRRHCLEALALYELRP
jgi:uncharacterized protein (DUF58 family)